MSNPLENGPSIFNITPKENKESEYSREKPNVSVLDISDFHGWKEFLQSINKDKVVFDDGNSEVEQKFNELIEAARSASKKIFFLKWDGIRSPRGATVEGKQIGWTQHGVVSDMKGFPIGTYERVVDTNNEQEMLVFLNEF